MTRIEKGGFEGETAATSGEMMFVVDTARTITSANDVFLTCTGLSRERIVGDTVTALESTLTDGMGQLRAAIEAVARGHLNYERVEVGISREDRTETEQASTVARVTPRVADGSRDGVLVHLESLDDDTRRKRELTEAYQRYKTLVEQSKDGVSIVHDGKNVFVNNRTAEMLGYSKAELIGESFLKPIVEEDRERVRQRYRERIRGESPESRYELRFERKDGERLTVEVNVNRIQYRGEPAAIATYRNVTERKQREEELSRFRRVIETAPHAIFLTDTDGTITYVNPAFREVTGFSQREVLGRTPKILKSGENPDTLYEEMWETITAGEVWEGYVVNQRATNELYHTHETIAPITDENGDVREFVAIQTDITERVERERLLGKLDRVLRHDLRNKLNVIETHGDLIRAQEAEGLSEHVDKILQSVDDLLETTEKGRGIIKLLSRPTHREHRDVVSVIRDVVGTIQNRYPRAEVSLDAPEKAPVTAVPELKEAIEELLVNAIEHNDQLVPEVAIRVLVDDTVRVRIADNGPGISEMEREVLQENEDIDQLSHGSGFGLWLVYWILRRSHGTITIEDTDPRGSVVTLEFEGLSGTDGDGTAQTD